MALIQYIISAQKTVADSVGNIHLEIKDAEINDKIHYKDDDESLLEYEKITLNENNENEIRRIIEEFARTL